MDTIIDLKNAAIYGQSQPPTAALTSNTNGAGVDVSNGVARTNLTVSVGAFGANGVPYVQAQESDDNTNWTACSDPGANTGNLNANTITVLSFLRTKRYVRGVLAFAATSTTQSVLADIVVIAGARQYGGGTGANSGVDRSPGT